MQQYPSYLNQPFQQPISYQHYPYNPMQTERISQLQQFQQSLQPAPQFATIGKIVESIDIVKATDIPMDGNTYYFPKADGTEIYAKQWLPSGQTRISVFKPFENDGASNSIPETQKANTDGIEEFTKALDDKFEELYKRLSESKPTNAKKKEVNADE